MKLRDFHLPNNIFLAPMHNVTTSPFRRFCRSFYNIGLVTVPLIYAERLVNNPESVEYQFSKIEDESPISIQLTGKSIDSYREAALYLESYNFNFIDINAGCPSDKSKEAQNGAFLLKDLDYLKNILETVLKHSSKPLSLKIRTGVNAPLEIKEVKKFLNDIDLNFITVHGRTVEASFKKAKLDLKFIKELKANTNIPLIANGDISQPKFAKHVLEYTNADGLMIGRGCIGDPEIFTRIEAYLSSSEFIPFQNTLEKFTNKIQLYEKILNDYIKDLNLPIDADDYKLIELRKNSLWLTKGLRNSVKIRNKINQAKKLSQLKDIFQELFYN
jgi:tRNA-dihydrouridine synthase B